MFYFTCDLSFTPSTSLKWKYSGLNDSVGALLRWVGYCRCTWKMHESNHGISTTLGREAYIQPDTGIAILESQDPCLVFNPKIQA